MSYKSVVILDLIVAIFDFICGIYVWYLGSFESGLLLFACGVTLIIWTYFFYKYKN